jgi:osmotically-inducible protein OsmY
MRAVMLLLAMALLAGCAAGTMMGAGQGGRAADGRSYEEARADNLLAAAVNRALVRDREVRAGDVQVGVQDGVVTLVGTVPSNSSAERAERLAREVAGVKGVVNHLRVSD